MAKLGERVLGEFQLGGAAVIAESAPILAASAPQDNSFSRVLEEDEVIMTNTFISPVFDGTQNLVRAGDTVASTSSIFANASDTSIATGEILTRNIEQLFIDVKSSGSAGDVLIRQAAVLADSIPRQIFEDEPILSQTEVVGNEESLTRVGDTVDSVMSPLDDSLSRNIDGQTVAPLVSSLDDSFSRLFEGDNVLSDSLQVGESFTRTFEEDEVIMSNTFISPVFDGTQNLVRDGNIATATSLALQTSADITAGQLLSLTTIPQFDDADTSGSAGDVLERTGIQSFNDADVSASSGDIISRVALEFLADGIISGSGGDVVSLQSSILDDSFSRNLFTDEPLLRPTTVLTDSFTSTLERDIALTIQSAVFSEEFTSSTDGDVQLRNSSVLDNSFSRLFDGSVLDRQALSIGNVFTRTFEEDEIIMSNTFIAPVFDGTQNLVRAGDSVFAQSNEFLPTTGITAGKLLTRETDVLFDETDILASAGDVLERVVDNLLDESQTSTISGDVLQRTLDKVFDESLIATTDGDTVSLLSVEFGDVETFGGFTDEPILLDATVSVESTAVTDDVDNVLSAQTVILDESISRNDDGDIVGVSSDVFGEIFSQTTDGDSVLPNQTIFADTFTRTIEEDETIMSNTFFAPVFDGTQNLVRSGDTAQSNATELDPTIGLTTGDSVLADTETLFNESDITSLAGDTVIIQSVELDPEYSFIANPGVVIRELGAGSPQLGGSQIGLFQLGLGEGTDGTILRADPLTFRTAIGDIVSSAGTVVGKGVSRKFVDALIASTLAEPVIEKSIGRKFDGDVVQIDFEEFVEVFTRTFDGRTATALASQIEAFRTLTEWALGQRQLGTTIEETREWSALELVYQFEKIQAQENDPEFFTVEEATNDLKARSEKVSVRELIDGGFTGVDLSGEGNTFNIRAPFDRDDVRPVDEWFVNSVDVENISRDTNTFEVELELVPEKSKEFDNEYGTFESPEIQSPSASQWTFEFEFGTIATRRVTVETTESSSGTLDVQELQLVLQPEQVRIFEENVSHLNLVYERSVPDGFDIVDDTSSDERNTVQISPPANVDESVVEGEYSFVSWETEWRAGTFVCTWEVATDEN